MSGVFKRETYIYIFYNLNNHKMSSKRWLWGSHELSAWTIIERNFGQINITLKHYTPLPKINDNFKVKQKVKRIRF